MTVNHKNGTPKYASEKMNEWIQQGKSPKITLICKLWMVPEGNYEQST